MVLALSAVGLTPAVAQDTTTEPAPEAETAETPAEAPAEAPAVEVPAEAEAQAEAEAPAEAPAAEAPAAEAPSEAPAAEAPVAEAPAEAPAQPEFVTETFGDWEVRCTPDKANCFMYQLGRDGAGNAVAEVTLVALEDGSQAAAGATVVTPLGTLLSEGLVIQVDGGQARKYDYNWCTRSGCFARFGLQNDYVNNMKAGNIALMQLVSVSAPERPVRLEISLTGFTAAFNSLPPTQAQ